MSLGAELRALLRPLENPMVRRIERWAWTYSVAGGLWFALWQDWRAALVLTVTGVLSIVNFRALQLQVRLLAPRVDGRLSTADGLLLLLRLSFLGGIVFGAFYLGSKYLLALILGFFTLPLALMSEALWQLFGMVRGTIDGR